MIDSLISMLPSFLTVIFWAFSAICANRATRLLGSLLTNLIRLFLAAILLGLWAHLFGQGLGGSSLWFLVLSGCVGFGFGDLAGLEGFALIGPRLMVMLTQCLAAPIAGLIEWIWLDTSLSPAQITWGVVILAGVALALSPREHLHVERRKLWLGCLFGLLSAFGQGFGAVLSRKAYQVANNAGQNIDGGTAAYQRALGGLAVVLIACIIAGIWQKDVALKVPQNWKGAWSWLIGHVLAGPTAGVSCYQWALATTPSGVVLPIVATTPLAIIPMALFIDSERPGARSLFGGGIAVIGAVALAMAK